MDIFFGFNVGSYVLSQMCEELDSVSAVVIYPGQLCLQMVTIRTEPVGENKGALPNLPEVKCYL